CHTSILLERGEVLLKGTPNDVTNIYTKLITSPLGAEAIRADIFALQQRDTKNRKSSPASAPAATPTAKSDDTRNAITPVTSLMAEERAHQQISDKEYAYGGESGRITAV